MNAIGGYFGLELNYRKEYHKNALNLNTGRNAFEYILKVKDYNKVYLPYYTCDVMLEPIKKLGLKLEFYHIDKNFFPIFDFENVKKQEVFVYNNYFGICDKQIHEIAYKCKNLIIDNSQAFFSKPLKGVDTFYSARKFFGVPDGAYLYTDKLLNENLEIDLTYQRCEHLLGRLDIGADKFYQSFKENEARLMNQPIKKMSKLTKRLLESIDYQKVASKRVDNFNTLHNALKNKNQLKIILSRNSVPMVYPYLINDGKELKKKLLENKIYIATYWPNVLEWTKNDDWEYFLTSCLVNLPIDQRYNFSHMKQILEIIL